MKLSPEVVAEALQESLAALAGISDAAGLRAQKANIVGEASPVSKLNALIKTVANDEKADFLALIRRSLFYWLRIAAP